MGVVEKQNVKGINQIQDLKSAFSEKISKEIQEMEGRRKHGQQQVRMPFGSCTCTRMTCCVLIQIGVVS